MPRVTPASNHATGYHTVACGKLAIAEAPAGRAIQPPRPTYRTTLAQYVPGRPALAGYVRGCGNLPPAASARTTDGA